MKKLFIGVVVLLILLVLACIPFLLRLDSYRAQIASTLSQRLGHKVVIGKLEAGFFPPALVFKNISLLTPTGDVPLMQVEQLITPINLMALLKASVVPQSLVFRGWTSYVRRNRDGSWAWNEWLTPTASLTQSAGWPIQSIKLERGEAHAVDPYGPNAQEFVVQVLQGGWDRRRQYVSINGIFTSLPAPVSFLFQSDGSFLGTPRFNGVVTLTDENRECKFDVKAAGGRTEVTGHADAWRFDTAYAFARWYTRIPLGAPAAAPSALLQNWQSHFDWQGSRLSFTQSANVAGGRSEANGAIAFKPDLSTAHLDLALQAANIQPIEAALFGNSPLEGTATVLAQFDLVLSSAPWGALKGQGALEIKDGRYVLPNASTQALSKAHTMKYLLKKFPGFLGGGLPYSRIAAHWSLNNGEMSFDDGFVSLADIKVGAVGSYNVPHRGLDTTIRVQINEKNSALLKELPDNYVTKTDSGTRVQPMTGKLQGTLAEWHLRASRGSKVPASTSNKLNRALRS